MAKQNSKSTSVVVNPTSAQKEGKLYTAEEVKAMIAEVLAAQATSAPVATPSAPKAATKAEETKGYKFLSWLDRGTHKVVVGTRDYVVVPTNIYLADKAIPDALQTTATVAGKVEGWLGALKTASQTKADALRPVVNEQDAKAAYIEKLAKFIATDPQGAKAAGLI